MRRIGIFAQGQLGNNLFVLAYALHLIKKQNYKITIFTDCIDLGELYEDITFIKDGRLRIKKWPDLMKLYMKLRSGISQKKLECLVSKIDRLFRVRFLGESWEIPQENELRRWNVGYFQDVGPAMSVKHELLAILNRLSSRIMRDRISKNVRDICEKEPYTAVHFRRGVYRNIPEYGLVSAEFVDLDSIKKESNVFISSDEDEIERELQNWSGIVNYFSISNLSTIEAFVVLSGASKIYLSNSTFAWWAGFFVSLKGGEVICPTPWFKEAKIPIDYLHHPDFNYKRTIFV